MNYEAKSICVFVFRSEKKEMNKISDKDLKKLGRTELLEMLIAEAQQSETLEKQLREAEEKLADRRIDIKESGSLSDACLKVNGVFEAAYAACAQYEENIRTLSEKTENFCAKKLQKAEAECALLREKTEAECKAKKEVTDKECASILADARKKAEAEIKDGLKKSQEYWDEIYDRLEEYRKSYSELSVLLDKGYARKNA